MTTWIFHALCFAIPILKGTESSPRAGVSLWGYSSISTETLLWLKIRFSSKGGVKIKNVFALRRFWVCGTPTSCLVSIYRRKNNGFLFGIGV